MIREQSLSLTEMELFETRAETDRHPEAGRDEISIQQFAQLARDNQRRLFQIAHSVVRNAEQAEDVAQDALLTAFRQLERLRDPARFRAWVGRIAFRLALNARRAQKRRELRDASWAGERADEKPRPSHAERLLILRDVEHAVDRLPDRLRVVLLLCTVEDMSSAEAASILRIPEGTVRSRLHQARKRLLLEVGP